MANFTHCPACQKPLEAGIFLDSCPFCGHALAEMETPPTPKPEELPVAETLPTPEAPPSEPIAETPEIELGLEPQPVPPSGPPPLPKRQPNGPPSLPTVAERVARYRAENLPTPHQPRWDDEPPKSSKGKTRLVIGVILGAMFLTVGLVVLFGVLIYEAAQSSPGPRTAGWKGTSTNTRFITINNPPPSEQGAESKLVTDSQRQFVLSRSTTANKHKDFAEIEKVVQAYRIENLRSDAYLALFDLGEVRKTVQSLIPKGEKEVAVETINKAIQRDLLLEQTRTVSNIDIRLILDEEADRKLVYVREWKEERIGYFCLWLVKGNAKWMIYDFTMTPERPNEGDRFSESIADRFTEKNKSIWSHYRTSNFAALTNFPFESLSKTQQQLHYALQIQKATKEGGVFQQLSILREAKEKFPHAVWIAPTILETPSLSYQSQEQIRYLSEFNEKFGGNANTFSMLGEANIRLKYDLAALKEFEKGYLLNPSRETLLGYLKAVPPGIDDEQALHWYSSLPNEERHNLAITLLMLGINQEQFHTINLASKLMDTDPTFAFNGWKDYPRMILALHKREYEKARTIYTNIEWQSFVKEDKTRVQQDFRRYFYSDNPLEAYRSAPNPDEMFDYLTPSHSRNPKIMEALVNEHKLHLGENQVSVYQAMIAAFKKDYSKANELFSKVSAKQLEEMANKNYAIRQSYEETSFETGNFGTYLKRTTNSSTRQSDFYGLLGLANTKRDKAIYQKLLEQAEPIVGKESWFPYGKISLLLASDQLPEAIKTFKAIKPTPKKKKKKAVDDDDDDDFDLDDSFRINNARSQLIRACLKKKDQETALTLFKEGNPEEGKVGIRGSRGRDRDDDFDDDFDDDDREKEFFAEEVKLLETVTKLYPQVSRYWYDLAETYRMQDQYQKAIDSYKKGLEFDKTDSKKFIENDIIEMQKKLGKGLESYQQAKDKKQFLRDHLLRYSYLESDFQYLEDLIKAAEGDKIDIAEVREARSLIRLHKKNYATVLEDIKVTQTSRYGSHRVRAQCYRDLVKSGKALEIYTKSGKSEEVFVELSEALFQQKMPNELGQLIELHELVAKSTENLRLANWRFWNLRNQFDRMETDLQNNLLPLFHSYRNTMFEPLYIETATKQGKILAVYRQSGHSKRCFQSCAAHLYKVNNLEQLKTLVAEHRTKNADDTGLPIWEYKLRFLEKDYQKLIAELTPEKLEALQSLPYSYELEDIVMRSYLREKRLDDAKKYVYRKDQRNRTPNRHHELLLSISQKDVEATRSHLKKAYSQSGALDTYYNDPDTKTILQDPVFNELRKQYPLVNDYSKERDLND